MPIAAGTRASSLDAEIVNLKLTIAKLQHAKFGASSERGARMLDQLELQLAELEEQAAQNAVADEIATSLPANSASLPACAPSPTMFCASTKQQPSPRTGTVPHSAASKGCSR